MGVSAPAPGHPCLGVVDWGIGGVGLVRLLDDAVPGLPVLYWSDTGAVPYGLVPTAELAARLRLVVGELAARGCTEVVLACNAASTVLDRLAGAAVPVSGVIAAGIAAVPEGAGVVGVVGGRRTIASGAYRRGLAGAGRTVVSRVAQPLSGHIEAGRVDTPAFAADLHRIVAPLRGADAVVLACTHYPAAAHRFAAELPGTVLVDPVVGVAEALARRHPGAVGQVAGNRTFLTTGDPGAMADAAHRAWGVSLRAATASVGPGPVSA